MRWFGRRRGYLMDRRLTEDDLPVVPSKGALVVVQVPAKVGV